MTLPSEKVIAPEREFGLKIERILFPTDFSNYANYALKYAVSFAQLFHARLYVLHVHVLLAHTYPPEVYQGMAPEYIASLKKCAQENLSKVVPEEVKKTVVVEEILEKGVPYQEIIRVARDQQIDLIIMSSRGRSGFDRALMGSTTQRVVSLSPCPVLAIRYPEFDFANLKTPTP